MGARACESRRKSQARAVKENIVKRRTFAKLLVAGAASTAGAARRLRLGIGTYTYHNLSVDDMFVQLQALNVKEIEMSRAEFMNFTRPPIERFESFRRKADAAGIQCVSYYALTIKKKRSG